VSIKKGNSILKAFRITSHRNGGGAIDRRADCQFGAWFYKLLVPNPIYVRPDRPKGPRSTKAQHPRFVPQEVVGARSRGGPWRVSSGAARTKDTAAVVPMRCFAGQALMTDGAAPDEPGRGRRERGPSDWRYLCNRRRLARARKSKRADRMRARPAAMSKLFRERRGPLSKRPRNRRLLRKKLTFVNLIESCRESTGRRSESTCQSCGRGNRRARDSDPASLDAGPSTYWRQARVIQDGCEGPTPGRMGPPTAPLAS